MLGFYIFILVLGDIMTTIKKSKLTETLKQKGLDEGLIDALVNIISKRSNDKKAKKLTRKLNKTRNTLRDDFIEFYGSYDNIPDSVKKVIER